MRTKTIEERFWSKVDRSRDDTCWVWKAGRDRAGYGQFWVYDRGRSIGAHRIAYELINGPIPEGMFVCHTCDNPPCCNPTHLFVGTPADNTTDRDQKGRLHAPEGSRHGGALLTEDSVKEMKLLYAQG